MFAKVFKKNLGSTRCPCQMLERDRFPVTCKLAVIQNRVD